MYDVEYRSELGQNPPRLFAPVRVRGVFEPMKLADDLREAGQLRRCRDPKNIPLSTLDVDLQDDAFRRRWQLCERRAKRFGLTA
jgi:hypothetical protein